MLCVRQGFFQQGIDNKDCQTITSIHLNNDMIANQQHLKDKSSDIVAAYINVLH